MGGGGGPPSKGGLGWGPDWISNWMEPKSFVVGKTRSGIWFLQFYIQRICTRTEEGLVAKSPLSPPSPFHHSLKPSLSNQSLSRSNFPHTNPSLPECSELPHSRTLATHSHAFCARKAIILQILQIWCFRLWKCHSIQGWPEMVCSQCLTFSLE